MPHRKSVCAHCGQPQRGSANIDHQPVCHAAEDGYPDCYRFITVYGEPIGIRRDDAARMRMVAETFIYIGEEYPVIAVSTTFNRAAMWCMVIGNFVAPWQTRVHNIIAEAAAPTRRYTSRTSAVDGHKAICRDTINGLIATGKQPLLVTDSGPTR